MANLVRVLVDLATDEVARERFEADPQAWVDQLDDGVEGGLTVDDVVACAAIARRVVDPAIADRLPTQDELAVASNDNGTAEEAIHVRLAEWAKSAAAAPTRAHLHAVEPAEDDGVPAIDPEHPAALDAQRPGLSAVPDDETIGVLDLVILVDGVPDEGVLPGAAGTVVAVHHDDDLGLAYEVEVPGPDGGRLFLGVVPAAGVVRAT